MATDALDVMLHGALVGRLVRHSSGVVFQADPSALDRYGLGSPVLSTALPLDSAPASAEATEAFFGGLLPEGARLNDLLARKPGLSRHDLIGLLEVTGSDVAGSLVLPGPEITRLGTLLDADAVAAEVKAPREYVAGGGSTAAGMQPKVALGRSSRGWHEARGGHPSTHLIKPVAAENRRQAMAEVWVMNLARAVGLLDYDVWLEEFGPLSAVVVERYDRLVTGEDVRRLHQEDAAQALALPWGGDAKFEREKAGASYLALASLLDRDRSVFAPGLGDRERLLQQMTFRVVVGDTDGHAKNHALLHDEHGGVRLAPIYDATPQVLYGQGGVMALYVAQEQMLSRIGVDQLVEEAVSWGMGASVARQTALDLAQRVLEQARQLPADPTIADHLPGYVTQSASRLLAGQTAGLGLGEFPLVEPLQVV